MTGLHYLRRIGPVLLTLLAVGCLQVDVHVEMHDDGSATITERVRLSRRLLELDERLDREPKLAEFIERANIDRRAGTMGEGLEVTGHEVEKFEDGSIESRATYAIPDITDLRLVNPFLGRGCAGHNIRIHFSPIYERIHSYHVIGEIMMSWRVHEGPEGGGDDEQPQRLTKPSDLQTLRNLLPVIADLLSDVEVTFRFTYPHPARHAGTETAHLFSFKGDELDAHGRRFLENEEVMLRVLQLDFDAGLIADNIRAGRRRPTGPAFNRRGWNRRIPPTTHLFDEYYKGRPKSQGGDQPG